VTVGITSLTAPIDGKPLAITVVILTGWTKYGSDMSTKAASKILIFDGHNLFIRNFVVNPAMDTNGDPIGGIVGTIRSIKFLMQEIQPSRVFVVWDGEGGSRKRRGIYSEYKAGRKVRLNRELESSGPGEDWSSMGTQMARTKPLLRLLGITQLELGDIEADDAIAYLVGCLDPTPKVVVSSDKDLWQLASPTTAIYWPVKKTFITDKTMADDGCLPQNWVYWKALVGDDGDNIKGVKGIGPKSVKKLFPELSQRVLSISEFFQLVEGKATSERKAKDVLDQRELVMRNVDLMQLTSPIISATSASVIRNSIDIKPTFNFTGFKLAMLNQGIQLTDADLVTAFRSYQMRNENAAP
jgi:5'-3' exonuclease